VRGPAHRRTQTVSPARRIGARPPVTPSRPRGRLPAPSRRRNCGSSRCNSASLLSAPRRPAPIRAGGRGLDGGTGGGATMSVPRASGRETAGVMTCAVPRIVERRPFPRHVESERQGAATDGDRPRAVCRPPGATMSVPRASGRETAGVMTRAGAHRRTQAVSPARRIGAPGRRDRRRQAPGGVPTAGRDYERAEGVSSRNGRSDDARGPAHRRTQAVSPARRIGAPGGRHTARGVRGARGRPGRGGRGRAGRKRLRDAAPICDTAVAL